MYSQKDLNNLNRHLSGKNFYFLSRVSPLNEKELRRFLVRERDFWGNKLVNPYDTLVYQALFLSFEKLPLIIKETTQDMTKEIIAWRLERGF